MIAYINQSFINDENSIYQENKINIEAIQRLSIKKISISVDDNTDIDELLEKIQKIRIRKEDIKFYIFLSCKEKSYIAEKLVSMAIYNIYSLDNIEDKESYIKEKINKDRSYRNAITFIENSKEEDKKVSIIKNKTVVNKTIVKKIEKIEMNYYGNVNIAVIGSQQRIGKTHFAILLATVLSKIDKTVVISSKESSLFEGEFSFDITKKLANPRDYKFIIEIIDNESSEIKGKKILEDVNMLKFQHVYYLMGTALWEFENSKNGIINLEDKEVDFSIILNFTSEKNACTISKVLKEYKVFNMPYINEYEEHEFFKNLVLEMGLKPKEKKSIVKNIKDIFYNLKLNKKKQEAN